MKSFNVAALALLLLVAVGCKPADGKKSQTVEGSVPAAASTPTEEPANKPQVTAQEMSLKQTQNQQLLVRLLNGVYGSENYDAKNRCWLQTLRDKEDQQESYCMSVARLDKVTIDDDVRWYVQMSGDEKTGSHAVTGAMGFFIFKTSDETIIAANPLEDSQIEFGAGPGKMSLLQLSPDGYFGWLGAGMTVHPDIYAEPTLLMAPKNKSVINIIGNLPYTYDDFEQDQDNPQRIKYGYRINTTAEAAPIYPIIVTEKNTETGKQRKFTAHFDRKRWEYRCRDKRCETTTP